MCLIAGGGGGWEGFHEYSQSGGSFLEGAEGGSPCPDAIRLQGWHTSGGFGGGGGACTAGGGGGGYTGMCSYFAMIWSRYSVFCLLFAFVLSNWMRSAIYQVKEVVL